MGNWNAIVVCEKEGKVVGENILEERKHRGNCLVELHKTLFSGRMYTVQES